MAQKRPKEFFQLQFRQGESLEKLQSAFAPLPHALHMRLALTCGKLQSLQKLEAARAKNIS